MLDQLNQEDRLRLLRFVCSFAWADLEVQGTERDFVGQLVVRLGLNEKESAQVEAWLDKPPRAEDVDPQDIPRAHRKLFLDAARAIIMADGSVEENELENLLLFEQLLQD